MRTCAWLTTFLTLSQLVTLAGRASIGELTARYAAATVVMCAATVAVWVIVRRTVR